MGSRENCKGYKYEREPLVRSPCLKCDRFPRDEKKDYYEKVNHDGF